MLENITVKASTLITI